jgi:hypothetical protein
MKPLSIKISKQDETEMKENFRAGLQIAEEIRILPRLQCEATLAGKKGNPCRNV